VFRFRSGSPLPNRWKIRELLPESVNKRTLQRKWAEVKRYLCQSQAQVARRYNRNRVPQPFKVGDLVYYKNHPISHAGIREAAKLMPLYQGPYKVDIFLTPVTVRLVHPVFGRFVTRAHVYLLKPSGASSD
jgi:hypothetical protein